jgi:hypothetical protein
MDYPKINQKLNRSNDGGKGITGGTTMRTKDGDTVKSFLDGNTYKVKKIVKSMAVLESEDGLSQILTELETLNLFYKKKEDIKV